MSAFFIFFVYYLMKNAVIYLFVIYAYSASAQHKPMSYDSLRLQAPFNVCMVTNDSPNITRYYQLLCSIDTSKLISGLDMYFYDLSTNRYLAYMYLGDSNALNTSIEYMKTCYQLNPNNHLALWHLGLCHYFKGNCATAIQYLNLYKSMTKISRTEKRQIKHIINSKKCKT